MKLMNKMAFALIALSCIANVSAYTWNFTNHTSETIDIKFGLKGVAGWYYQTVEPTNKATFAFEAPGLWPLNCLHSFNWKKKGESQYKSAEIVYLESKLAERTAAAVKQLLGKGLGSAIQGIKDWGCVGRDFIIIENDQGKIMFITYKK